MSEQELFEKFDELVREYVKKHGATTDTGEQVFEEIYRAVARHGQGAQWSFLEGFLRRCK